VRRPGLSVARDPASIIRQRESYDPAAEPADPSWGCLFDFNPTRSLLVDVEGGISLADPVGGVIVVTRPGFPRGAQFNGSNYLVGASPFAALGDLTGGCTFYEVSNRTDAATSGSSGTFSLDSTTESTPQREALGAYHVSANNAGVALSGDDAGTEYDTIFGLTRNVVKILVYSATTSSVGLGQNVLPWGPTSVASPPHNPSGLNRVLIGASGVFAGGSTVGAFHSGEVFRCLACEGPPSQDILDKLLALYV